MKQRQVSSASRYWILGTVLSFLFLSGCQASRYAERFGLGTIDRQKAKAAEFDPYPLNDIAPSVVGGRPPGFFNPLAEPRRNELLGKNPSYNSGYPNR
ncbi:MAG: membrane or secreted protein [Pirellula sp.]